MESDWSVAAGADDPVITTHWSDAATCLAWIDLRVNQELQQSRIAALAEASSPAMAHALALLNTPSGLLVTTKCDRWTMSNVELAELADALDTSPAAYGYGSYLDLQFVSGVPMADFLLHEEWARTSARRLAASTARNARADLIVRPAHENGEWGFGMSVYCYACDDGMSAAEACWSTALGQIVPIVISAAESLFAHADEIAG